MGVDLSKVRTYLEDFTGTARRMQVMGEYRRAIIVDDYAHHPTEVKATLEAAREMYKDKRLLVIFHPHTFTRTKALLDEFSESFKLADELVILDIFGSAREEQGGVSSQDLVDKIKIVEKGKDVKNIGTLKEVEDYLRGEVGRNDVVLLMGAGDVFRIGENLIK
jgi:UDP-N-acetylmuramate--alanine ligase